MADPALQASLDSFLSKFSSFNDPGALDAWNELAKTGATSLAGFDPHPTYDLEGNITGYGSQSTKEAGAAAGGTFGLDTSGAFPGTGSKTATSFNWTPPATTGFNQLEKEEGPGLLSVFGGPIGAEVGAGLGIGAAAGGALVQGAGTLALGGSPADALKAGATSFGTGTALGGVGGDGAGGSSLANFQDSLDIQGFPEGPSGVNLQGVADSFDQPPAQPGDVAALNASVGGVPGAASTGPGIDPTIGGTDTGVLLPPAGTSGAPAAGGPLMPQAAAFSTGAAPAAFSGGVGDFGGSSGVPGGSAGGFGTGDGYQPNGLDSMTGGDVGGEVDPSDPDAWKKAGTIADKVLAKLSGITGNQLLTGASVGLMGLNAINQKKAGSTLAKDLTAAGQPASSTAADLLQQSKTGPLATTANSLIADYQSGKINSSTQFDIDKWKQQQIAATKNYYAKAGIPDSSAALHAVSQIEAQAEAMQDAARQNLLTQGIAAFNSNNALTGQALSAEQLAQQPLIAAATANANSDQALSSASASALNSLLLLQALSQGKPTPGASAP